MILSAKTKKRIPAGVYGARLLSMAYAKSPDGRDLVLKSGEKGLEAMFFITEYDTKMSFIFWLKPELEYQLKNLSRAMGGTQSFGKLYVRELVNKMVFILIQEEVYYRNGEPILDTLGNHITYLKVAPKFFKYDELRKPVIKPSDLIVEKFMDGLQNMTHEETSST